MNHRAEVFLLYTEEINAELGPFETATEARAACAPHEDGMWEAQGVERWYRALTS